MEPGIYPHIRDEHGAALPTADEAILAFSCGQVGLLVAAKSLEVRNAWGLLTPEQVLESSRRWWHYWRTYWQSKSTPHPLPFNFACEATIPMVAGGGKAEDGAEPAPQTPIALDPAAVAQSWLTDVMVQGVPKRARLSREGIDTLIDALNDDAAYIRRRAYTILARLDLSEHLSHFQQALEKSRPESRKLIVQLVNRLAVVPSGIPAASLIDMHSVARSLSDPDPEVRSKALFDLISAEKAYLSSLPGSITLPQLSQDARNHCLNGLRWLRPYDREAWAAEYFGKGLAECASADTPVGPIRATLAILESEREPSGRRQLIENLASISRIEELSREGEWQPRLTYRYARRLPASLIRCFLAIIQMEDPKQSAPLRQVLLRTDMSGFVPELLATLESPHGELRKYAVCGLAKIGHFDPQALRAVIAALDDSSVVVRRAATRALNDLSNGRRKVRRPRLRWPAQATSADNDRTALLEMALESANAGARAWAAKRLPVVGSQSAAALNRLAALLADPEPEVRVAAIRALARFREAARAVMDRLDAGLHDESPEVRRAAAEVLVLLRPPNRESGSSESAGTFAGSRAGQTRNDNGLSATMVWIPPGDFTMGSPQSEKDHFDNEDQVQVSLSKGFWLGQHPVTQAEWQRFMRKNPWSGKIGEKEGDDYPATYVSWHTAMKFCERLTDTERQADRLPWDWQYTLPTEAQWEYACRAGTKSRFSFGDDDVDLSDYGWWRALDDGNAKSEPYAHRVGQKKANPWGLSDMHGNVWEWCRNWYAKELAGGTDPQGPSQGSDRALRGGSWNNHARLCRSASRVGLRPDYRMSSQGFRVAAVPTGI